MDNNISTYYGNKYNTYVGARYVPKIMGEWNANTKYEPLSVVLYQGSSYTSKTNVPKGVIPTNEQFWALTGNYNVQVEMYRQEVERVKNLLGTKITVVETVSDMKLGNYQAGETVKTLGYYAANDGGGAIYTIVSGELTANDCTIYATSSGAYAVLIYDNVINFKQIGGKPVQPCCGKIDNTPFIENFMTYLNPLGITLYIPSGVWAFTKYTFVKPMIIKGENMFNRTNNGGLNGTVITAFENNQDCVWQLSNSDGSGNASILANFTLENLIFSTCDYNVSGGNYSINTYYDTVNACVVMRGAEFGTLKDIFFHYLKGCALNVMSCNEINFGNISFRHVGDPTKPVLKLVGNPGVRSANSSFFFDNLQFEACIGSLIYIGDYLTNNVFNNIMFEPGDSPDSSGPSTRILADSGNLPSNLVHSGIIEVDNTTYIFGTIFNNFVIDGLSAYATLINNQYYMYDSLFKGDCTKELNFQIHNVNCDFGRSAVYVFYGDRFGGSASVMDFGTWAKNSVATDYPLLFHGRYIGKFNLKFLNVNLASNVLYPENVFFKQLTPENVAEAICLPQNTAPGFSSTNYFGTAIRSFNELNPGDKTVSKMQLFYNSSITEIKIHVSLVKDAPSTIYLKGKLDGVAKNITVDITESTLATNTYSWKDILKGEQFDNGLIEIGFSVQGQNTGFIDMVQLI